MEKVSEDGEARAKWKIDLNIPVFKHEGREYIDRLVYRNGLDGE